MPESEIMYFYVEHKEYTDSEGRRITHNIPNSSRVPSDFMEFIGHGEIPIERPKSVNDTTVMVEEPHEAHFPIRVRSKGLTPEKLQQGLMRAFGNFDESREAYRRGFQEQLNDYIRSAAEQRKAESSAILTPGPRPAADADGGIIIP